MLNVTCFDTQAFREPSTKLMKIANMDLRMWVRTVSDGKENVLGRRRTKVDDSLFNSVSVDGLLVEEITKIISLIHQIYDPIGFLCPVTVTPKLWLQESWVSSYRGMNNCLKKWKKS